MPYPENPCAKTVWITITEEDILAALASNLPGQFEISPLDVAVRRHDPAGYVRYGNINGEFAVFDKMEWCAPRAVVEWFRDWFDGKPIAPISFCFTEF